MTTNSKFSVVSVQPVVYLDGSGEAVNGYRVKIRLNDFDELHLLNVENIDPQTVKKAALALVSQREALANL